MKKNIRNMGRKALAISSGAYTPGHNHFGQKAKTRFIVLERETAFEQYMEAISQLNGDDNIEFTVDTSCFKGHEDELTELMAKVQAVFELMSGNWKAA